jgi:hypothetical protein
MRTEGMPATLPAAGKTALFGAVSAILAPVTLTIESRRMWGG